MLNQTNLYHEIHEQPDILTRLLHDERATAEALAAEIRKRDICHVVIAARGTSDNAARYAKYLLGAANGLSVGLATPSLFTIYEQPPKFNHALVVGISQSGKSPDIVAVLAEARRQGALTAAITNIPDSDLAQTADFVLDLHAGQEKSVAATKTYTSELAAIALLSVALSGDDEMNRALAQIPQKVARVFSHEEHIAQVAERYRYMQACVTIGRGYNYATAFELSLKLKELTYTVVEPYSSADFLHGPVALVHHGFPVIVFAPSGKMLTEVKAFVETLQGREAEVMVISDDDAALAMGRVGLRLPAGVPEWLSPLTSIVPGQLFAMNLANTRGYDVDQPRGLRKVTETR
ncbi:MAG: SIS domain-containing protein [Caldilineales bacterium]|nr:SIS domain-containing protein [Caldilineales bacterium]